MKLLAATAMSHSLLVSAGAFAGQALAAEADKKSQTISRAGSQASVKGPAEYFTGNVRIDPLFPVNDSAHFSGAYVTFEPGARSAWHIHPTGQHLLVFGDIFGRDNLDFRSREIATISALASMEGVNSQLQAHFNIGFNTGLTEAQMRSLISVLEARVGKKESDNANEIFSKVLSNRAK